MLDTIYWLAAGLALVGLRKGNWTAIPLLASAAFCLLARWLQLPFNLWLWLMVDVLTLAGVAWPLFRTARPHTCRTELVILALFVPGVFAYLLPAGPAHGLSTVLATAQLLVTLPFRRFGARWNRSLLRHDEWTHFDLRVMPA